MHGIERTLDRRSIAFLEQRERQIDRHRMLLADIAHVRRALECHAPRFHRGAGDRLAALALELAIDFLDLIERRILEPSEPGAHEIVAEIREQHAEGREHPGRDRNDDGPHSDLARDLNGMQWPRSAIGHQREVAGIKAAFGGDAFHRIGHCGRRDL